VLSNRKQVWLLMGIAAGLTYLASREPTAAPEPVGVPGAPPQGATRTARAARRRAPEGSA